MEIPVRGSVLSAFLLVIIFLASVSIGAMVGQWSTERMAERMAARFYAGDSELGEGGPLEAPVGDSVFNQLAYYDDDALSEPGLKRFSYTFTDNDNLYTALQCFSVPHELIMSWCQLAKGTYDLTMVKPGQSFALYTDASNEFVKLEYNINDEEELLIVKDGGGYRASRERIETDEPVEDGSFTAAVPAWVSSETGYHYYRGAVSGSFYESAVAAGMSPAKAMAMISVFGGINFSRDLQEGDKFSVVVAPGGKAGDEGPILAAMIETRGKPHYMFRFEEKGKTRYFNREGKSFKTNRLITPVLHARITSSYTKSRLHPILHKYRPHLGVDYAAAAGTPVRASAAGKVARVGYNGGFGKTILIAHGGGYMTQYGHLSRYGKGIRSGARVKQGQVIGYVGMTGLATGPHLDYRVFVNGKPINPLAVTALPDQPISNKAAFNASAENMLTELSRPLPLGPPAPWPAPPAVAAADAPQP